MVLSGALARCQDEISNDLHSEIYYDQKAEEGGIRVSLRP